jgi:hypothetical protein
MEYDSAEKSVYETVLWKVDKMVAPMAEKSAGKKVSNLAAKLVFSEAALMVGLLDKLMAKLSVGKMVET